MKTIAVVIASLIAFSGIGHAADFIAPVKEIMEATKSNWADNNSDWTDIFDASRLDRLYSRDFVAKYQAAAQFPAVDDDGISPFDYDVIVNGQDACPLEDLRMAAAPVVDGVAEVTVRFKNPPARTLLTARTIRPFISSWSKKAANPSSTISSPRISRRRPAIP